MAGEMQIVFPLDTEDFNALSSEQFDSFNVHGLVDDATDELGRDILEVVVEEDGDPDWADE
ncbi:hypothetical protein BDM02DRAFT_3192837 [Thelephora ganbajun]|uniref:Uncharacterized protein n=1 Tax=Thelephora ganbajun TaxID=370292 RepID=A0ACB6YZ65_THEGA|nr:hypothetical protein BDM02DRAFT_3192837 [Thelephora ganbajun]